MKSINTLGIGLAVFCACCVGTGCSASQKPADRHFQAAEVRKWADDRLRAELEKVELGEEDECLLVDVVRRGGEGWWKFLEARYGALMRHPTKQVPIGPINGAEVSVIDDRCNLHLLTALRRVQKRSDPLRIIVAGKLKRRYSLQEKPCFTLLVTNLDEEKQPVKRFTVGGDYRTGRLARWRFEVRDEKGRMLAIKSPFGFMGGGLVHWEALEYGESWKAELPLENYVHISAPGKYTFRVFYHNREKIVDRQDISDLVTSHSADITLEVAPISVSVTDEQRRNARKWISQLPDAGPVKMAMGGILECKDFLDPDSPAGRLQRMYTSALPDLIDGALDPNLKPGQRAWVLGLLFAITGHNDPRGVPDDLFAGRELLGSYEYTDGSGMGSTRLWVADSYEYSSEAGSGSFRGGKINPEKQRAFAEKWRVWKTDGYYTVEKR